MRASARRIEAWRGGLLTRGHGIVADVRAGLKTPLTELGDSRVRLQVEVPPAEIEVRLESKARRSAAS